MRCKSDVQAGFTLIELMVSLVVVTVILAGLYSNFIMQSRVQTSQSSAGDAIEDLRLAAQIMDTQLKLASNICWDATNGLVYQPLGAATMSGCSGAMDHSWGAFQFRTSASAGGSICWDRPNLWYKPGVGCQEVLRGLDPSTGLQVSSTASMGGLRTITLTSRYQDIERQNKSLSVSFDVLPRNN